MSGKSARVAELMKGFEGGPFDAHYLGFFKCFNEQLYFEAHDVLEALWLRQGKGTNYAFYKGLIQLAGAFVHLQKNRLGPAGALFRLAEGNLRQYPSRHEGLDVRKVSGLIKEWLEALEAEPGRNPLPGRVPALELPVDG